MTNIALPSLKCDESKPLANLALEAAEPLEPGTYNVDVEMKDFTSGAWMATLGGLAATPGIFEDGRATYPVEVTTVNDNFIRIVGRANPGGKLTLHGVERVE